MFIIVNQLSISNKLLLPFRAVGVAMNCGANKISIQKNKYKGHSPHRGTLIKNGSMNPDGAVLLKINRKNTR